MVSGAIVVPRGVLGTHTDDTDYSIEVALLAAIVESSDDATISKTLDGRIRSWNGGAMRIVGYTADEVIGQPVTIIIPPELRDEEKLFIEKLRRGERIDHFDTTRITKDGRRIPISLTISPVRDSNGTIVGASKVARDISERRRVEYLQRESEEKLGAEADALQKLNNFSTRLWQCRTVHAGFDEILDSMIDLVGADKGLVQFLDAESGVLSVAAQRGFTAAWLEGVQAVTAGDVTACGRALKTGQRVVVADIESDPAAHSLRDGARAAGFRAVISTPLRRVDNELLGVVSIHFARPRTPTDQELRRLELCGRQASDFIHRCAMEEALHASEETLREADCRKDEFLALLAHELRNPLAPIRYALAASSKAGRTPEQQRRAEEVIERQVAHMSRLLDDLLEVSRITRGTLELKKARTELTAVLGTAIESARPILDAKHHALSLDLPKHAVAIDADAVRLAQVFSNLLINAAKYTDPGGNLELIASLEGAEIIVRVRDNGIGISDEMLPKLFTLFTQAKPALARSEGGLGVGLALVRGLVELHGGNVAARSDGPGKGSEFTVRLPLGSVPTEQAVSPVLLTDRGTASALRVLIVDDSRDAADMCAALVELSGHDVRTAYTGHVGLTVAEAFRPYVLLLDIGLPDVNGYELARTIRTTAWGREAVLIAVTGWGQTEDRRRAFESGFDHHLTKPIAPEAMQSLLELVEARPV